jgi:gamma-glutamyltranspeptidase/glutathione hydrolase
VDAWVARGRVHHQYQPDRIEVEPDALSEEAIVELERRGHRIRRLDDAYGNMQAILWDRRTGEVTAASDPRGIGSTLTPGP